MLYIYKLNTLAKEMQQAFVDAADRAGQSICLLGDDDIEKTLTTCLGAIAPMDMSGCSPSEGEEGAPFLIMDVDDLAIDPLLATLRAHKVRIDHKCMVTDKNKDWTLKKLIGDVEEEHALMGAIMRLAKTVEKAETLSKDDYPILAWMAFERELDMARDMFSHVGKVEIPVEVVMQVQERLTAALETLRKGAHA